VVGVLAEIIIDTPPPLAINQQTITVKRVARKGVPSTHLPMDRNDTSPLDAHPSEGKAHFQMRGVRFLELTG